MRFAALSSLFTRTTKKPSRQARPPRHFRAFVDALERRELLAVLWVDNNPANVAVHPADFTTISAAVAAANPGDTIRVATGVAPYDENVLVDKPLTFLGGQKRWFGELNTTTVREGTSSAAFTVQANNVTISGFTITPQPTAVGGAEGISTDAPYSSLRVLNNTFTGNTLGIFLNSDGVLPNVVRNNKFISNNLAGPATGNGIFSDLGLKNVVISHNTFTGHTTSSINLFGGPGALATPDEHSDIKILSNSIKNDSPIIAVNLTGSEISWNTISNPTHGDGILLAGAVTETKVVGNKLTGNATSGAGISVRVSDVASGGFFNVAHDVNGDPIPNSGLDIVDNEIYRWGESGIYLRDLTSDVYIAWNSASSNGTGSDPTVGDGISIADSSNILLTKNTTVQNRRNGVYLNNSSLVTINWSTIGANGVDGIRLENGSTQNLITRVDVYHNGDFVAHTGNGVHLIDSSNNRVEWMSSNGNASDGILVEGTSAGNVIRRNTAWNNYLYDLEDTTVGSGTAGTANTWYGNNAQKRSPAGLG
ncbi:MAG: nitrous oxide reductase family maturation protein NosD [Pirellulales bacterium]